MLSGKSCLEEVQNLYDREEAHLLGGALNGGKRKAVSLTLASQGVGRSIIPLSASGSSLTRVALTHGHREPGTGENCQRLSTVCGSPGIGLATSLTNEYTRLRSTQDLIPPSDYLARCLRSKLAILREIGEL